MGKKILDERKENTGRHFESISYSLSLHREEGRVHAWIGYKRSCRLKLSFKRRG